MALLKVKGNLERLFDKNLNDLVRGIRNNNKEEDGRSAYIANCLEEIKTELRNPNLAVKTNAIAKLTYLQMLGYDISWAGFNIIEVMSSTKFTEKRLGYLSACQSFHSETEVLMLATNLIRKDINSHNTHDTGVALSSLSCFMSPDLARDLHSDILSLLTSTRPYVRKKAVLILYKVFLKYPDALRPSFPRLKEKLEDPDPGVQSAAVNVICELARKNPKNYLSLAPTFFKLMTSSSNNWMMIKIIKLFGALTPLEPRLGKKLIEPLTKLIHSTSAMSLLYECINTVIAVLISISSGMPNHTAAIQLCVQKLRILIEDSDQNLKYLGLLAMSKILKTHPKSVQGHKDLILRCLDDSDDSIRLRALDLLYAMVNKKNLMEIVKKLMIHMSKAEGTIYRDELIEKTIQICSQNDYIHITNFEWYISVLVELARMDIGVQHGKLVAHQLMDVSIRVSSIRPFAVTQMTLFIENQHLLIPNPSSAEVLYAAVWVCGEFASEVNHIEKVLDCMLKDRELEYLPGHILCVYIHNALKLFIYIAESKLSSGVEEDILSVIQIGKNLEDQLNHFLASADLEVQERASVVTQFVRYALKHLEKNESLLEELSIFTQGDLNPVAPKAQKKVPIPEGLDLDEWINEPLEDDSKSSSSLSSSDDEKVLFVPIGDSEKSSSSKKKKKSKSKKKKKITSSSKEPFDVRKEPTKEELEEYRQTRLREQNNNPNYLKDVKMTPKSSEEKIDLSPEEPSPQELGVQLHIPGLTSIDKYFVDHGLSMKSGKNSHKKAKKEKKHKKRSKEGEVNGHDYDEVEDNNSENHNNVFVSKNIDMPEGAVISDEDADILHEDDPHKALGNINLDDLVKESKPVYISKEQDAIPAILFGERPKKVKKHKKKKRRIRKRVVMEMST
ncbi:AP-3 complex subunit delta-1 [Lepeophtheirus salmonis]|uniref:AP-3 complex subunit delta-1 n=1 Tax=Lepeophtheirus salmonis TaxID=72036 RepID=UPI001AEAE5E0|nr:AP-3 complex subunit delta-1-like [Lepeophtheirus salmonis]